MPAEHGEVRTVAAPDAMTTQETGDVQAIAPDEDDLDDIEFLLDDIEDQIAPLAL